MVERSVLFWGFCVKSYSRVFWSMVGRGSLDMDELSFKSRVCFKFENLYSVGC